jgi:hypothetical protein
MPECDKILYLNANFMRKLRGKHSIDVLTNPKNSQHKEIQKIFEADVLLVPFFFEDPFRRTMNT